MNITLLHDVMKHVNCCQQQTTRRQIRYGEERLECKYLTSSVYI